jgi:purine-nucleoside phosphorylase
MIDMNKNYKPLIETLNKEAPFKPEIGLILGSGLGEFAQKTKMVKTFATNELPNYPQSTVDGHKGFIHFAELYDKKLLIYQGRIHPYEGYSIDECVIPVFIAEQLGVKKLILTNAAGGLNHLQPADLMLITSMMSFNIKKELAELVGLAPPEIKNNFIDFPSDRVGNVIRKAALEESVALKEGVYWYNQGPSYETPAEIRMTAKLGGDAVGMSTVHEAIYASTLGMEVGAISCITNFAAGISPNKLNHLEVMETAELVKEKFEKLVKKIIELI